MIEEATKGLKRQMMRKADRETKRESLSTRRK